MATEPPRPRLFAGDRVRALRARLSLSQTRLSQQLGISTSYLSQIESGDRPITGGVLAALARAFPLDWVDVAPEDESAALVAAMAAGTDPSVPAAMIDDDAVRRGVRQQPLLARRMAALHAALQRTQEQLRVLDDRVDAGGSQPVPLPWEEVRDWFQGSGNYIDALDRFAEGLAADLSGARAYADRLERAHGVRLADDGAALRSYDPAAATLRIDAAQPIETRAFQMAHQLIRLEAADLIEGIVAEAPLQSEAARELLRVGLANYGAGALVMPYASASASASNKSATACRRCNARAHPASPSSSAASTWPATSPNAIRRRGCNSPNMAAPAPCGSRMRQWRSATASSSRSPKCPTVPATSRWRRGW